MQRNRWDVDSQGIPESFDNITGELAAHFSGVQFSEEFMGLPIIPAVGSPVAGTPWRQKIVGAAPPTVLAVAGALGGAIECTLTADSQKEDAVLYMGDTLNFDASLGLIIDQVMALTVLPSATGVQAVWGMSSVWIDGPDNAAKYIRFGCKASGEVFIQSADGTNTFSQDSGIAFVAAGLHFCRIDASDPTFVRYFIDGVEVSTSASKISFAAAGVTLQPYCSAYKPSGVGVATLRIGKFAAYSQRK